MANPLPVCAWLPHQSSVLNRTNPERGVGSREQGKETVWSLRREAGLDLAGWLLWQPGGRSGREGSVWLCGKGGTPTADFPGGGLGLERRWEAETQQKTSQLNKHLAEQPLRALPFLPPN